MSKLLERKQEVSSRLKELQIRKRIFLSELSDEKLLACQSYLDSCRTGNEATQILACRRLTEVLTEQELSKLSALWKEEYDLMQEDANIRWSGQLIYEAAKAERQLEAQRRAESIARSGYHQRVYNRQVMLNALNGIENAIRNLNSPMPIIP
jgi:hypothetical protein